MECEQKDSATGYVAFFLHAHLPFVRSLEPYTTLEEKWFFEALTESYLPLLMSWERLVAEGIEFKLNLSLSPPLLSMLVDPLLRERYARYLENLLELCRRERERTKSDPTFSPIVNFYYQRMREIQRAFLETYQQNLLSPLARLQAGGYLEIITSCATHGYLPLMLTREAQRAQVRVGRDLFASLFGQAPHGIWLPECGYTPGLESVLVEEGIGYFIVASHGLLHARPSPATAVYAPVWLRGGIAVLGRDWETSHQVWSRTEGYPGDPVYREFYRDIGYDLDYHYLEPFLIAGLRGDTGLKYYRITGATEAKEPYDFKAAQDRAREHARDFVANREKQLAYWAGQMASKPIVVAPYDAELFGHWWFEGPYWLEQVLRQMAQNNNIRLTTLSTYLEAYPPTQEVTLGLSSWGEGGYNRVWLNPTNDWIYPPLHLAEKAMIELADSYPFPGEVEERALNQAARELLLAQSSDWPFIIYSRTAVDYATRRLQGHLTNFFRLRSALKAGKVDLAALEKLEAEDNIFPQIDFHIYRSGSFKALPEVKLRQEALDPLIIMLSWEYPPYQVGGLGIHVRDLSGALAELGLEVHVLTFAPDGRAVSTKEEGVYLHRLPTYQRQEIDFMSWVWQLNAILADFSFEIISRLPGKNLIIHAHDWLTAFAAQEIKATYGLPLVATIHATEHGRNRGLHTPLQQSIHAREKWLVEAVEQVICCSQYMKREIKELFQPPAAKVRVIPNAVRPIAPTWEEQARSEEEPVILYVGRLVVEKGVQVLLEAFAQLRSFYPQAKLLIAGTGPYLEELKARTAHLDLTEQVHFLGFVSEAKRNELLARCSVSVFPSLYEPFGMAALEAMAAGTPLIVSQTGGLAEVVEDRVTGLCFRPGDVEDLRRCLLELCGSTALARRLGRQARNKVLKEYNWQNVARQTLEVYREVLALPVTA